jgi:hypothetical protein
MRRAELVLAGVRIRDDRRILVAGTDTLRSAHF